MLEAKTLTNEVLMNINNQTSNVYRVIFLCLMKIGIGIYNYQQS